MGFELSELLTIAPLILVSASALVLIYRKFFSQPLTTDVFSTSECVFSVFLMPAEEKEYISTVSEVRHPGRIEPIAAVGEAVRLNQLHSGEDHLPRDGRRFLVLQADSLLAIEAVYDSRRLEDRLFEVTYPTKNYDRKLEKL